MKPWASWKPRCATPPPDSAARRPTHWVGRLPVITGKPDMLNLKDPELLRQQCSIDGAWVDADTLFFRDPTNVRFPTGLSDKLHWHSECLFASVSGNPLLAKALDRGLVDGAHAWGNPGGIKDIVAHATDALVPISEDVFDPGFRPRYNFVNCEVMLRQDVGVADFLITDVAMLKLYNTYFRRTVRHMASVAEFLAGGSLLARLFLHIEADIGYWLSESELLLADAS